MFEGGAKLFYNKVTKCHSITAKVHRVKSCCEVRSECSAEVSLTFKKVLAMLREQITKFGKWNQHLNVVSLAVKFAVHGKLLLFCRTLLQSLQQVNKGVKVSSNHYRVSGCSHLTAVVWTGSVKRVVRSENISKLNKCIARMNVHTCTHRNLNNSLFTAKKLFTLNTELWAKSEMQPYLYFLQLYLIFSPSFLYT